MDRERFRVHLKRATDEAITFARTLVNQELQGADRSYVLYPCQSNDQELRAGESVHPEDANPDGHPYGPWSADRVVDFLCREGCIPEWIDISVTADQGSTVLLQLLCCGRFTASDELLYYRTSDRPPFGVKSPPLPPGWKDGEKFDLEWRSKRPGS